MNKKGKVKGVKKQLGKDFLNEAIDKSFEALNQADSVAFAIRKADDNAKNFNDTLKITDDYLKKISETQKVLILTEESWVKRARENQNNAAKAMTDMFISIGNWFSLTYKYLKYFADFGEKAKSFYVLKKEATSTVLQEEISALEQKRELGKKLLEQREEELAQLERTKRKTEEDSAENDKYFNQQLEHGKIWINKELYWKEERLKIMDNYLKEYGKLFEKEIRTVSESSEGEIDALVEKYEEGAESIKKAYETTQHRGNYGIDDDKREFGYHTNTHEHELKAMQSNYDDMAKLLSLKREIGNEALSVGTGLMTEYNQEAEAFIQTTEKNKTKIKDIHFDANAAILEDEEEIQQALSELKAAEEKKRLKTQEENLDDSIKLQQNYNDEVKELQEDLHEEQINALDETNNIIEDSEADSHKARAEQWQEYAEKVSAISQQISEVTGMVTSSLGGMFSELSASYAQEIESLNEKITAVDEEKNAALEQVTLTEDERRAREEELAQQKLNLETATSDEQKSKADERIATLQGELGAEDSINREFESKKASLEKEKEKKEKAQKKAEKMQKRLEMGQRIVESIGNVAAGVAKALSHGPILGPILAAIVSTAGAIQVGVMTKQLAKMEDGGLLKGKRHAQGGMRILGSNIEVEGGEYVINRQSTDKNLGLLSYINRQRRELDSNDMHNFFSAPLPNFQPPAFTSMFEKGGQVPMLPMSESTDVERLLAGMQNLKIDSHVSVTDINTVQQNMTRVDEWTGI